MRSFATRRLAVDVLKKLQSIEAYQALLDARADLVGQLTAGTLGRTDAALAQDLLARTLRAISPYFN